MYKVLIVDDEKRICSLIKVIVDWKALDLDVIGFALDGREALAIIEEKHPDIIITDIRMPEIDGLELIEATQSLNISPQFIILSGYKEFEYAHRAMQYGVRHYLLKPIQASELIEALNSIKSILNERDRFSEQNSTSKEIINSLTSQINTNIVQMLANGQIVSNQPQMGDNPFRLAVFHIQFHNELDIDSISSLTHSAESILKDCFDESDFQYGISPNLDNVWVLFSADEGNKWKSIIESALDKLNEKMIMYGEINVGISSQHFNLNEAFLREEAIRAARWKWIYVLEDIIRYEKLPPKATCCIPRKIRTNIMKAVDALDCNQLTNIFSNYAQSLSSAIDPDVLCDELLLLWENVCAVLQSFFENKCCSDDIYLAISQSSCASDAIMKVGMLIIKSINIIIETKDSNEDYYVRLAKEYIQNNLREGISLFSVSEELGISSVYFSSLFKQKTGVNFKDYVTEERINRAKQLIKQFPNRNISDIGLEVGYPNQQHFSKLFLKTVGVKPSQYKKLFM